METKLFLIEESISTICDSDEISEWEKLVNELGLINQKKLISSEKSPICFPILTKAENEIWGAVFEVKQDYKQFSGYAIPLKILSLIALCEKEKYFDKIEIWHSREVPDPLVIGRRYDKDEDRQHEYTWLMLKYKIAQFGEKIKSTIELLPIYDEYKRKAIQDDYQNKLNEHIQDMNKFKFQVESMQ